MKAIRKGLPARDEQNFLGDSLFTASIQNVGQQYAVAQDDIAQNYSWWRSEQQ
jgi:hypothetical protein